MELGRCGSHENYLIRLFLRGRMKHQPVDSVDLHIPRVVIAGIQSGCGKTTVTRGLMAALKKRGLTVQPYKIGPDFIDPSHHTRICGRVSRNLDLVMTGEEGVLQSLYQGSRGADIAIIEGVMGMYDGVDGTSYGSSAHIARILKAPLLLVIPVQGMATSVHAIASGFKNYEPGTALSGVILNQVGSTRHRQLLQAREEIAQVGFIPKHPSLHTESRHLGLVMGYENRNDEPVSLIEESCDVSRIIEIASSAPVLSIPSRERVQQEKTVKIGIAHDPAFCFYYQHNLDLLSASGAELVFFSPMTDHLPDVDALYLGGGYPELYAEDLEAGHARIEIKRACEDGIPVYGECGGLLYLTRGLEGERSFRWTGILPGEASMCSRFQALDYVEGETTGGTELTRPSCSIRGHEFHYSVVKPDPDANYSLELSRGKGIHEGKDGMYAHETVGCYTHAWFSEKFALQVIKAAEKCKKV